MEKDYRLHEADQQMELFPKEEQSKPWALVVMVIAVAITVVAMFWTTFAQAEEKLSEERLTFLMKFAGESLDVYTYDVELPRIIYVSSKNLQYEFYGAKAMSEIEGKTNIRYPEVIAIYEEGTMILNEDVDYTDPDNEGTLVHELVHHLQAVYKLDNRYKCLQARETPAYHAQNMWVMASGHGDFADAFHIFLHSQCPSPGHY